MGDKRVDPRDKRIGQNIRRRRLLLEMSQEKLGNALGLTFQQIQKYEKGTNRVSGSRIAQICAVLHCTVVELFEGTLKIGLPGSYVPDPMAGLSESAVGVRMAKAFAQLPTSLQHTITDLCEQQAKMVPDHQRAATSRNVDRIRAMAAGSLG